MDSDIESIIIRERRQDERLDAIERQVAELQRQFRSLINPQDRFITHREKLLNELDRCLQEEDVRELCFALSVEYDNLPARGVRAKIRELVDYLERNGRLYELIGWMQRHYPDVKWPAVTSP